MLICPVRTFHARTTRLLLNGCIGALVLAHSLRDAGTTKKLAVLVTLDTLSAKTLFELQVLRTQYGENRILTTTSVSV
jgi:hypothetical protein